MQRKRQDHCEADSPELQGPSLSRAVDFGVSSFCVLFLQETHPELRSLQRLPQAWLCPWTKAEPRQWCAGVGSRQTRAHRDEPGGWRVPWGSGEVAEGKMIEAEGQVGPA